MVGSGPSTQQNEPQEQKIIYDPVQLTINDRWALKERLGKGGYGLVHKAHDKQSNTMVAVKLEISFRDPSETREREVLRDEYEIMKTITEGIPEGESIGFPRPIYYASSDFMRVMVMELLGNTVAQAFSNGYPKLVDVYTIGIQVLNRLEHMHNLGLVHLDLKNDNIYFGKGSENHRVYLADFGLSERYLNADGTHRRNFRRAYFVGTKEFSSRNVLDCYTPSRRDDIESLGYVLISTYFVNLPWIDYRQWHLRHFQRNPEGILNLVTANQEPELLERPEQSICDRNPSGALEMKSTYPLEDLCRGMPGMREFLEHARGLQYDEKPNYSFLRQILRRKIGRSSLRVEAWKSFC